MDNDSSFALSEVIRKLANLIRIGKIEEIQEAQVRVKIDRVITGWLPIVGQAGDTSIWIPLTKGEQVVVFSPYGESAQAFVLRSINYDAFKAPDEDKKVNLTTESDIKIRGTGRCRIKFDNHLEVESEGTDIYSTGEIEISALDAIKLESTLCWGR